MILDEIVANKKTELAQAQQATPMAVLERAICDAPAALDFQGALDRPGQMRLIAEIKRSSPSAGALDESLRPADHARTYRNAGADALSVLTDAKYFKGSLDDLAKARLAARLPTLRKDFIIDPYQVFEARAHGADAILLIARLLDVNEIQDLMNQARRLRMCALLEVHGKADLEAALKTDARLIGINNRNLDTLRVDLEATYRLAPLIPGDRVIVSESGISEAAQVRRLREIGVSAILVGQSIVQAADPGSKVRELLGRSG